MHELHPQFIENMRALLGDELGDFVRALDAPYSAALRVDPLRGAAARDAAMEFTGEPVPWAANGFYIRENTRPGTGYAHHAGAFYIQEASAMLPAAVLNARPGERILDLCAAPGGKSSQIAFAMNGEGILVSNEPDTKRARMLAGNLERLGIKNAMVVNEYPPALAKKWPGFFDAIMVDAPCSGEGMFRREPASRGEWEPASPEGCAKRQAGILDEAAKLLRPGGRLVYSTCTFNSIENDQTVSAFLERHPEFSRRDFALPGLPASENGMLRIFPHRVSGDGQFAALLIKSDDAPAEAAPNHKKQKERRGDSLRAADPAAEHMRTLAGMFDIDLTGLRPVIWGEYLAAFPEGMPPADGIKVITPGIMLAKIAGKRLEPAHQLAMSFPALPGYELSSEETEAYLRGETVPCDASGWLVARRLGLPLGWGKASGGILKNHLPKGLRKL